MPIRLIQGFQTLAHRRVFGPAVSSAILRLRAVRDLPARITAFGVWPVHVDR